MMSKNLVSDKFNPALFGTENGLGLNSVVTSDMVIHTGLKLLQKCVVGLAPQYVHFTFANLSVSHSER